MKHMNPKLVKLLYEGFSITTLENMSNEQLNLIYKKVVKEQATASTPQTKNIKSTNNQAIVAAKAKGETFVTYEEEMDEGEVTEKSVSKKQHGLMGAAYSVEKGKKELKDIPKSYRKKVKDVVDSMSKKQVKDFAKTKTSKLPEKVETKESDDVKKLEESIMRLVEKHAINQFNKSDILKMINKR